jgi:hypothetical protein
VGRLSGFLHDQVEMLFRMLVVFQMPADATAAIDEAEELRDPWTA